MFNSLDISTSGLVAQRYRLDVISGNVANINSTRSPDGRTQPFQRRQTVFSPSEDAKTSGGGVGVKARIEVDRQTPFNIVNDPYHPDQVDGKVVYPNIDLVTEQVNAIEASRAYEANLAAMQISKQLAELALRIIS